MAQPVRSPSSPPFANPPDWQHKTCWVRGRRAFLLVEATLTAVIIAVGLVLISRGIGGSLNALSRLQAYDHLLQLAEAKLSALEIEAQQFHALARRSGTFESPDAEDQWTLEARRVQIADLPPDAVNRITLTVRSSRTKSPTVSLATFWPSDWLSE